MSLEPVSRGKVPYQLINIPLQSALWCRIYWPADRTDKEFLWASIFSIRPWPARWVNKSYLLFEKGNNLTLGLIAAKPTQKELKVYMDAKKVGTNTLIAYILHVSPSLNLECDEVVLEEKDDIWEDTPNLKLT